MLYMAFAGLLLSSCGWSGDEQSEAPAAVVPAAAVDSSMPPPYDTALVINWADSVTLKKSDYKGVDSGLLLLKKTIAHDSATKNIDADTKAQMKEVGNFMKKKR